MAVIPPIMNYPLGTDYYNVEIFNNNWRNTLTYLNTYFALKETQIIAGSGLTGGGDLSADRTLNVVSANDGIVVNADNISLDTQNILTSTSTTKPLSANMGKILQDTKLNLTGGTLTGGLNGTTATFSGNVTANKGVSVTPKNGYYNETGFYIYPTDAQYPRLEMFKSEPTPGKPTYYVRQRRSDTQLTDIYRVTYDGAVTIVPDGATFGSISGTTATFSGNVLAANLPVPVGGIILMGANANPASTYINTTWSLITTNRVLRAVAQGSEGSTGGSDTFTLTQANIPSYNLTATEHTHTRGTMEITGTATHGASHGYFNSFSGAFSGNGSGNAAGGSVSGYSKGFNFTASNSWTGATSTASATTVPSGGSGTDITTLPAWYGVGVWKRLT